MYIIFGTLLPDAKYLPSFEKSKEKICGIEDVFFNIKLFRGSTEIELLSYKLTLIDDANVLL
jgi:hypothetical protein